MKKLTYLILFIALIGCTSKNNDAQCINLGKQKIIIYEIYKAKYSVIKFYYPLDIGGKKIYIYGSNGGSGYYYKNYSIKNGDTIETNISIYYNGYNIYLADVDFSAYEINE